MISLTMSTAVKARDDFCKNAMFANAKLRLLMTVVGFERLGVEDVPGASWVVPSAMTAKDLHEIVSEVNKALVSPVSEENDPREQLRRKPTGSARDSLTLQSNVNVNFGSESEGEDEVADGFLFPPNPRSKSNALEELKKKRKKKRKSDAEKEPLDDEILEERRQARLTNTLARQAKIKSDLFIHASDEESDEDADKEFFRLEEERRKKQAENVKKAMLTGETETAQGKKKASRKRKSDTGAAEAKRARRKSAESDANSDEDNDILMADLDGQSPRSQQEVSTSHGAVDEDTPLTSAEDDLYFDDDLAFSRDKLHTAATEAPMDVDDDEEDTPVVPSRRRMRGGFVLESDSE